MNKLKFLSSFAALALFFAACSNVDDPNPNGGEGGVAEGNYTVEEMCGMTLPAKDAGTETFTVEAYIVGSYNFDNDPKFVIGAENAATTSILIADDPEHTDTYNNIMAIKLGNFRDAVNLADNPGNYKKKIVVTGIFEKYCGIPGLVNLTKVVLDGKEIAAGSGGSQGDFEIPADAIFSETFAEGQGDFTIENVIMDDPMSYVWTHDDTYKYMKASAYVSGTTYPSESWLISPAIDLTGKSDVSLNSQHAIGPAQSLNVDKATMTLWFCTDYTSGAPSTANWEQTEIPTWSTTGWGWVNVTVAVPATMQGQSGVRFAYKYATTDESATWEIKNVYVK